jgi:hypothetical protein
VKRKGRFSLMLLTVMGVLFLSVPVIPEFELVSEKMEDIDHQVREAEGRVAGVTRENEVVKNVEPPAESLGIESTSDEDRQEETDESQENQEVVDDSVDDADGALPVTWVIDHIPGRVQGATLFFSEDDFPAGEIYCQIQGQTGTLIPITPGYSDSNPDTQVWKKYEEVGYMAFLELPEELLSKTTMMSEGFIECYAASSP